jgi:hypothetical protein
MIDAPSLGEHYPRINLKPQLGVTMKLAFLIVGLAFSHGAIAAPKPEFFCTSIGRTFVPYYEVSVYRLDATFPDYYAVFIERQNSLAGDDNDTLKREGQGKKTRQSLTISLSGGDAKEGSESLRIRTLPNGLIKGEMSLEGGLGVELSCQIQ